ncbi:MAG: hypothetical protein AAF624_17840 [Bacteroidota bacterium]
MFALVTLVAVASTVLLLLIVSGEAQLNQAMETYMAAQADEDRQALRAMRAAVPLVAAGLDKAAFADSLRVLFPGGHVVEDSASVTVVGTTYLFEEDQLVGTAEHPSSGMLMFSWQ